MFIVLCICLHLWDEAGLLMVYDLFNTWLNSVWRNFIKDFYILIQPGYWPIVRCFVFFFCWVFIQLWLHGISLTVFFAFQFHRRDWISWHQFSIKFWWSLAVNPWSAGFSLLVEFYLVSVLFCVIDLFRNFVFYWFNLAKLHMSRNSSIYSRFYSLLECKFSK